MISILNVGIILSCLDLENIPKMQWIKFKIKWCLHTQTCTLFRLQNYYHLNLLWYPTQIVLFKFMLWLTSISFCIYWSRLTQYICLELSWIKMLFPLGNWFKIKFYFVFTLLPRLWAFRSFWRWNGREHSWWRLS